MKLAEHLFVKYKTRNIYNRKICNKLFYFLLLKKTDYKLFHYSANDSKKIQNTETSCFIIKYFPCT